MKKCCCLSLGGSDAASNAEVGVCLLCYIRRYEGKVSCAIAVGVYALGQSVTDLQ